jgi:hypothetical protein
MVADDRRPAGWTRTTERAYPWVGRHRQEDGMGSTVRPGPSPGEPAPDAETYRRAALEARAQAEALRRAVVQADALVGQLEQLVESLLAILEYPKAYEWPPLSPEGETDAATGATTDEVTVVIEPGDATISNPGSPGAAAASARDRPGRTGPRSRAAPRRGSA